jgi:hypothetical protein
MHWFLAKIVVTNLWPQASQSELTLKKATLDGDQGTASKDLVQVPIGPVTRARAKKFKDVLNDVNPIKNNETQQRKGTQDRSMDKFEWKTSTRFLWQTRTSV